MQRLKQKVALVTGGAAGLGKAIAQRLAVEGAKVVITDIDAASGQSAAKELGVEFRVQDVAQEARWGEIVKEINARHGGLHVLVNNAGIFGSRENVSPQDMPLAEWRRVFAANVESVLLGCQAVMPVMAASGGGSIVNISSITSMMATPYGTAYGASKATVRQLTRSIAQHCAEQGLKIRCNSVHPGVVRSVQWDKHAQQSAQAQGISFDAYLRQAQARVPLGEFVTPEEIAAAVAFLACDESRHMTGAKMIIDGGHLACNSFKPRD